MALRGCGSPNGTCRSPAEGASGYQLFPITVILYVNIVLSSLIQKKEPTIRDAAVWPPRKRRSQNSKSWFIHSTSDSGATEYQPRMPETMEKNK